MVDIRLNSRSMKLTKAISDYCKEKISKFDYLLENATDVTVEFTESSHTGSKDKDFSIEIKIILPNARIFVRESGPELYAIIDSSTDILARRLKRYKDKLSSWEGKKSWKEDYVEDLEETVGDLWEEVDDYSSYTPKISRKTIVKNISPMHNAEAIEHLELQGLDSYLFKSTDTGTWCIVRKSKGGYELIVSPKE